MEERTIGLLAVTFTYQYALNARVILFRPSDSLTEYCRFYSCAAVFMQCVLELDL